jgi:hypothetical protein
MSTRLLVIYRGADKSLARPTSRCILFDGENISFDSSLFIHINSTNIPPVVIINRIHENQNLLSLRTYQHPGNLKVFNIGFMLLKSQCLKSLKY